MGKPCPAVPVDLFGMEQQTPRANSKHEAAALREVLMALKAHPAVPWFERMNSGAARIGGRFIRFGWPGCSDLRDVVAALGPL